MWVVKSICAIGIDQFATIYYHESFTYGAIGRPASRSDVFRFDPSGTLLRSVESLRYRGVRARFALRENVGRVTDCLRSFNHPQSTKATGLTAMSRGMSALVVETTASPGAKLGSCCHML